MVPGVIFQEQMDISFRSQWHGKGLGRVRCWESRGRRASVSACGGPSPQAAGGGGQCAGSSSEREQSSLTLVSGVSCGAMCGRHGTAQPCQSGPLGLGTAEVDTGCPPARLSPGVEASLTSHNLSPSLAKDGAASVLLWAHVDWTSGFCPQGSGFRAGTLPHIGIHPCVTLSPQARGLGVSTPMAQRPTSIPAGI